MDTPKRYHPALVTLHWLVALLVVINLYLGLFVFPTRAYADQQHPLSLTLHMAFGIAVLALVIVRFVVRLRFKRPPDATSGSPLLDLVAKLLHYALYLLLLTITLIGLAHALGTGHFQVAFLGAEHEPATQPASPGLSLLTLHGLAARTLIALVAVHVSAALYHQFIRKDNLIARMWFDSRRRHVAERSPDDMSRRGG